MFYTIKNLMRQEECGNPPKVAYYADLIDEDGKSISIQFLEPAEAIGGVYEQATDCFYYITGVLSNPKPISEYKNGDVLCFGLPILRSDKQ